MILPNFVIAGSTRSGTTSLYYYLKQHPEIGFPDLKEPRYFSSINLKLPQAGPGDNTVDEKLITNITDYARLYADIENYKRVGDASSEYLYHYNETAIEIYNVLGDIPVLIILRNPIERAHSAYNNLVRDGRESEVFEKGLALEESRIENNWDMMWAYKKVGLYYEQVNKYMKVFSRVNVIIFEDFVENIDYYLKDVFEFLDVSKDVDIDTSVGYSYSGKPKNKFIGWITSRNNQYIYPLRKAIMDGFPRSLLEKIAEKMYTKSQIKPETRNYLKDYFQNDVKRLEGLLSKDLSHWQ